MRLLVPLLVIFLLISCSSDLDFKQLDGVEFTQNAVVTGVYFQANQSQFLNTSGTTEISEISSQSIIDIFKGKYIQDNLVKLIFEFEIENTFDRNFEIEITFLDDSNQMTQTITLLALQNSTNTAITIFENASLDDLKTSKLVNFNVKLLSGSGSINSNNQDQLTLKSIAKFTLMTSK